MATDTNAGPVERVPDASGGADSGAVGFALPDVLGIEAGRILGLMERVVDAGFEPVMSTEVCGVSAPSLAAALAARRPGVQLGTAIVPLGARSEAALAMDAATVAQIAGAPFLLGVGTSTRQIVEDWHGRPHDPRLAATLHRLKVLRGALDGKRRGSFRLPAPPGREVRVLLAALGPRMIELGLGVADGVILNHTPPSDLPVGAEPATVFAFCWVAVNEDAQRRVRRELTSYVMARPYARHYTRMGFGDAVTRVQSLHREGRLRDAPATLPQDMVDAFYVTPEGLADRLRAYREAGATPVVLPVAGSDPGEDVARFLAERSWEA